MQSGDEAGDAKGDGDQRDDVGRRKTDRRTDAAADYDGPERRKGDRRVGGERRDPNSE